jgi:hypothetical protein
MYGGSGLGFAVSLTNMTVTKVTVCYQEKMLVCHVGNDAIMSRQLLCKVA